MTHRRFQGSEKYGYTSVYMCLACTGIENCIISIDIGFKATIKYEMQESNNAN